MSLLTNLISYWKLDEASGDALDAQGSNTLAASSTPGSGTGVINTARVLVATSDQYFFIADNASLSTGDIDFSISAWIKFTTKVSYREFVTKDDFGIASREYWLDYDPVNDRVQFNVSSDGSIIAGTAIQANNFGSPPTGTFFHIVAWHDSVNNQIGIVVNNGTPDLLSYSAGVFDGTAKFSIGTHFNSGSSTNNLDGVVDEIGFWKRVLTNQDISDLYNSGAGFAYPFTSTAPTPTPGPNIGIIGWINNPVSFGI